MPITSEACVTVSMDGDVYSEGLMVVLTGEGDSPRIRSVELGRP